MRILVCGGRDFDKITWFRYCMEPYLPKIESLISGHAKGTDMMAENWADEHNIPRYGYPANWERDGKAAGPIRNQVMLDAGRPDIVIAFPGGRGTADMVKRAERQNIPVQKFSMMDYQIWLKSSSQVTPITTTPTS